MRSLTLIGSVALLTAAAGTACAVNLRPDVPEGSVAVRLNTVVQYAPSTSTEFTPDRHRAVPRRHRPAGRLDGARHDSRARRQSQSAADAAVDQGPVRFDAAARGGHDRHRVSSRLQQRRHVRLRQAVHDHHRAAQHAGRPAQCPGRLSLRLDDGELPGRHSRVEPGDVRQRARQRRQRRLHGHARQLARDPARRPAGAVPQRGGPDVQSARRCRPTPDYGLLYISSGDGGDQSGESPTSPIRRQRAQTLDTIFGKILRIDPDPNRQPIQRISAHSGQPSYSIPTTNPWAADDATETRSSPTLAENYAYGLPQPVPHRVRPRHRRPVDGRRRREHLGGNQPRRARRQLRLGRNGRDQRRHPARRRHAAPRVDSPVHATAAHRRPQRLRRFRLPRRRDSQPPGQVRVQRPGAGLHDGRVCST